ncbi:MAG TPA: lanthionine synthetase C family protein [Thermoanaerobaculia bacterium]|nr:lanthionine synthetase C family protein [Thermoanaerobaculia bacterium]
MTRTWHPLLEGPLAEQASRVVREIADALPTAPSRPGGQPASLAGGMAGEAVFYSYLALATPDEAAADRAAELVERAADELSSTPMAPNLYAGFAGVAWAMEHLQGRLFESGGEEEGEDPMLEIDEALLGPLSRSPWAGEYDLIGGLAGLGVYAIERLPRPSAVAILEQVVTRLAELAEEMPDGTAWFSAVDRIPEWQREFHPNGYYNLGVAHGLPGVVPVLAAACAAGVAVERARPLLDGAVRFLLAHRLEPGAISCFAGSYAPDEASTPTRLAWCYGDPGIASTLLAAARAVGEPEWERHALDIARVAAARPEGSSYVRDAGICHGAAGLGHLFNRMYQETGDEELARAARFWIEKTFAFQTPGEGVAGFRAFDPNPEGEPGWRTDPGFLEGTTGIGLALLAAISDVEPAWDRVLLASLPPVAELSPVKED